MNRLYIDGMIASEPVFKMEPGEVPHLTFRLGVRHKTRSLSGLRPPRQTHIPNTDIVFGQNSPIISENSGGISKGHTAPGVI